MEQKKHAIKDAGASVIISDISLGAEVAIGTFKLFNRSFYIYRTSASEVQLPPGTAKITYTSGTTGSPKGVCLSQAGMEKVASSLLESIGARAAEKHLAVLPLPILLENIAGLYTTLLAGGTYIVKPQASIGFSQAFRPDFNLLISELINEKVTSCILVPELLKGLLLYLGVSGLILPDMRFMAVGGSKVSSGLLAEASAAGLPVYEGYGLSESASVVAVNTPEFSKAGTVGKILPHINLALTDDGEIILQSPAILGYTNGNFASNEYYTGDIGYVDDEGYLHVTGRKKNIIINSYGRNIAPEWPESELLSFPQIAQCFIYGDAAPELSALIVPISSAITQKEISEIINSANQKLPAYARIGAWRIVPPFTPMNGMLTSTGRLRRSEILKHYQPEKIAENVI